MKSNVSNIRDEFKINNLLNSIHAIKASRSSQTYQYENGEEFKPTYAIINPSIEDSDGFVIIAEGRVLFYADSTKENGLLKSALNSAVDLLNIYSNPASIIGTIVGTEVFPSPDIIGASSALSGNISSIINVLEGNE